MHNIKSCFCKMDSKKLLHILWYVLHYVKNLTLLWILKLCGSSDSAPTLHIVVVNSLIKFSYLIFFLLTILNCSLSPLCPTYCFPLTWSYDCMYCLRHFSLLFFTFLFRSHFLSCLSPIITHFIYFVTLGAFLKKFNLIQFHLFL